MVLTLDNLHGDREDCRVGDAAHGDRFVNSRVRSENSIEVIETHFIIVVEVEADQSVTFFIRPAYQVLTVHRESVRQHVELRSRVTATRAEGKPV